MNLFYNWGICAAFINYLDEIVSAFLQIIPAFFLFFWWQTIILHLFSLPLENLPNRTTGLRKQLLKYVDRHLKKFSTYQSKIPIWDNIFNSFKSLHSIICLSINSIQYSKCYVCFLLISFNLGSLRKTNWACFCY